MKGIEKILIIKLRAIGDVVLAIPVISNVRKAFPEATIDFLTERPATHVVLEHPDLDSVLILDKNYLPVKRLTEYIKFVSSLKRTKYDLVFDLFGNPRSAFLSYFTGAKYRVGYNFRLRKLFYTHVTENRGDQVHEVEFNLDALRRLGIAIVEKQLYFPVNDSAREYISHFWIDHELEDRFVVAINASGGWSTKRWPLEYFAQLGDKITNTYGATILLIWGPGERQQADQIAALMKTPAVLAPATNLKQLAALLERCGLMVTNDSGPMHIAAAVGTPVVAMFGPTNPKCQGPYGSMHEVVVKAGLWCLGCNGVTCKIGTNECMVDLSVDTVMKAIEKAMNKDGLTIASEADIVRQIYELIS
jgi:predicted lipopolysaccharide heptosyltransferase III